MGKRFLHNRAAVVTVAFVLLIALIGILAPLLAPHDPYVTDILNKFAPYSLEYPLGTDHLGRCVLSRLIYGIRPTLGLALLTMLGTIALGALLGVMAGYFRGVVEEVIMRAYHAHLMNTLAMMTFWTLIPRRPTTANTMIWLGKESITSTTRMMTSSTTPRK